MPKVNGWSQAKIALVAGLSKREVQMIVEMPHSVLLAADTVAALKWAAVIGSFVAGGMPLLAAARLVAVLAADESWQHPPSRLINLADQLPHDQLGLIGNCNDFQVHDALWRLRGRLRPDTSCVYYTVGAPLSRDALIVIVDGGHIYSAATLVIGDSDGRTGQFDLLSHLGELVGARRGEELTFRPSTVSNLAVGRIRIARATALSIINVSLAIRNALDRIADDRSIKRRRRMPEDA